MGKTTDFLKECMADALLKLMRKKPYEKITVQEICDEADVGRATYFRNFSSKNEAIVFKLSQDWKRWAEENEVRETRRFTLDNALTFFEYELSHKKTLEAIYAANLQSVFYESFNKNMAFNYLESDIEYYEQQFYSYALFGIVDAWIKRDFKETPQEMAKILNVIIKKQK